MLTHVPPVLKALFCGRASPDKLRYCGRGGHLRSGTCAAGSAPFFVAEPVVPSRGTAARTGRARPLGEVWAVGGWLVGAAGEGFALAPRIGSPLAKPASLGLASGLGGCFG